MEKEFDFKNIGKQMPYRTPDGFFDRMQEQVSARTKVEKHKKQLRMRLVIAATLAAAAMVLGLVFSSFSFSSGWASWSCGARPPECGPNIATATEGWRQTLLAEKLPWPRASGSFLLAN